MRHKQLPFVFALVLVLVGSGCVASRPVRAASVPPAPQPPPPPAAEQMPISIVQNASVLPPYQPVPREALPPLDPPEPAAPRTPVADSAEAARRRTPTRKPAETSGPASAPAAPVAAPATLPAGTLVASDPNLPGRAAMAAKIADARARANRVVPLGMTASQHTTYKRIQSFIKLAQQALDRGDLRQAGELADRAATLARALAQ